MVFETWLKSDLKKPMRVVPLTGNLFSADNNGNLVGVEVFDNGQPAQLTGAVTGYVIRADGATVTVTGELDGNKASIVLPASAYIVVGQVSIVIKVGTVTVGACVSNVYRTNTDTLVDSGRVIPSISELLAEIENMRTATAAANTATENANTAATNANTKAGQAETAAGNANTAAGKIDNMTASATTLSAGSQATVSVTEVDGHKHIEFGVPKGESGNETIDDTAGIGDTDKVWSADKSTKKVTDLKNALSVFSGEIILLANYTNEGTGNYWRTNALDVDHDFSFIVYDVENASESDTIVIRFNYSDNTTELTSHFSANEWVHVTPNPEKTLVFVDFVFIRSSSVSVVSKWSVIAVSGESKPFKVLSDIDALQNSAEQSADNFDILKATVGANYLLNEKYTHTGTGTYWRTDVVSNPSQYKSGLYVMVEDVENVSASQPVIVNVGGNTTVAVPISALKTWYKLPVTDDTTKINLRLQHGGSDAKTSSWKVVISTTPTIIELESIKNKLDVNSLDVLELRQGAYYASSYSAVGNRVTTTVFKFPFNVAIKTPLRTFICSWNNTNPTGLNEAIYISGGIASYEIISLAENTYYTITFANDDDSNITPDQVKYEIVKYNNETQYSYTGVTIPAKKHRLSIRKLPIKFETVPTGFGVLQGSVCISGKIYQFYNGGYCQVYDASTYAYINGFEVPSSHYNSVTYDSDSGYVYAFDVDNTAIVFTINETGYTLIRTLKFTNGYYTYGGIENGKLLTLAYSQNDYRNNTNNHMICTVYDANDLTDNGDGTYTPQMIKTFNHDFIYSVQDVAVFYGKLYVLSSYDYTESPTKVVVLNYDTERIDTIVDNMMPGIKNAEDEGLFFIEYDNYYTMAIGTFGGYYEFNFN